MKAVLQRVKQANISIDNLEYASIDQGLLVLVGFSNEDNQSDIKKISKKILNLRIFSDKQGKMNLSLQDINGAILIVSQFTLYAECKKGNRPSFINAASLIDAKYIYNEFVNYMKNQYRNIKTGKFGAMMDISLKNHGPVTIFLDSQKI